MSVVGDIKAKIVSQLQAMDDGAGNLRFKWATSTPVMSEPGTCPFAEVFMGGGTFMSDVNGTLDDTLAMVIRVTIDDEAVAETIWEELLVLWFNNTNMQELSDLNVLNVIPLDAMCPVVLPGGARYIMDIKYELVIRYSY